MAYHRVALPRRARNITGNIFGKALAIVPVGVSKHGDMQWLCVCHCGKRFVRIAGNLGRATSQTTRQSCGCLNYLGSANHWKSDTPEHKIWCGINYRCTNPNSTRFENWGGRGIAVCREWAESFTAFYADMGPRPSPKHSIDRIDNELGYFKANCRWATAKEQGQNQRARKNAIILSFEGETKPLKDWAEQYGICTSTIVRRINHGVPLDLVFKSKAGLWTRIELGGEVYTLTGLSRKLGIGKKPLARRLRNGELPADIQTQLHSELLKTAEG